LRFKRDITGNPFAPQMLELIIEEFVCSLSPQGVGISGPSPALTEQRRSGKQRRVAAFMK
jgi:hypothetical protein